jgi:palmitoyl-protein thioesterase
VSLAGPQLGVYGKEYFEFLEKIPGIDALEKFGEKLTTEEIYEVAYGKIDALGLNIRGQQYSVGNMWHDPKHYSEYLHGGGSVNLGLLSIELEGNKFLPKFNGQTDDAEGNKRRKDNFMRLKKAVFLTGVPEMGMKGTDYDGGIAPAATGIFGYLHKDTGKITPMHEQEVYTKDLFGLKSLDEANKLLTVMAHGKGHSAWIDKEDVGKEFIFDHLV